MLNFLNRIVAGQGAIEDIDHLEALGRHIKESSHCGLGKTAPNPVLSTIRYFRQEYEAHIREKRCPALVCVDLIRFRVDADELVQVTTEDGRSLRIRARLSSKPLPSIITVPYPCPTLDETGVPGVKVEKI